jgi:hypothetical protein
VESHVHSKLAYRRFAADPQNGGNFIDLSKLSRHNRQLRRRWFCGQCEDLFAETKTASWFDNLGDLSAGEYNYGPFLQTFAVSLAYRYALLDLEDGVPNAKNREMLRRPMQYWRDFLLKKRTTLGSYSMHGFLEAKGSAVDSDATLGGQVMYCNGMIIIRTGPLIVFGVIAKPRMSGTEAARWALTEILPVSGLLSVIHRAEKHPGITEEMAACLNVAGEYCMTRSIEFHSKYAQN